MPDIAIVMFPGSNCDRDAFHVFSHLLKCSVTYHWHEEPLKSDYKLVVLPGGFSYGDYLRAGAIARFSAAVDSLHDYLEKGGFALGICNGFQILVEAKLLPGILMKNQSLRFQCQDVFVRLENHQSPMFQAARVGDVFQMPIAHSEGRYVVSEEEHRRLTQNGQIVLRYCDPNGEINDTYNANGSYDAIAGVCNERGNVFGLMPHPERSAEKMLGSDDGLRFLKSICQIL